MEWKVSKSMKNWLCFSIVSRNENRSLLFVFGDFKMLHLEEEAFRKKPGKLKLLFQNVFEALDFSIYNKSKGLLDSKLIVSGIFMYYGIKN